MVPDLAFYNAGCDQPLGVRRLLVLARRMLRRLLRPIFLRQVEIYQNIYDRLGETDRALGGLKESLGQPDRALRSELDALAGRHDDLADRLQETIAFGWDYVAMVRRLAALEDRIEALAERTDSARSSEGQLLLPFPEVDDRTWAEAG